MYFFVLVTACENKKIDHSRTHVQTGPVLRFHFRARGLRAKIKAPATRLERVPVEFGLFGYGYLVTELRFYFRAHKLLAKLKGPVTRLE